MQSRFGVLVIGDEILSGKRQDKHLAHVIATLGARGASVAWYRVAGDERRALCETLYQTQQDPVPVLCFGGIGATPDDNTREAAAEAFGCSLQTHADALALIESQFGGRARPNRVRMAELPEDCLIQYAVQYYREVLDKEVPISRGGDFIKYDGLKVLYRSIILPMSDDGATISGLLGAANCREIAED